MMAPLDVVSVICRDTSHDGRTCWVAAFSRNLTVDSGWHRLPAGRSDRAGFDHPAPENRAVWLSAEHQVLTESEVIEGASVREQQSLLCKLCGLKVSAWTGTLQPIFDKLHDAGVSSIELRQLAAIVAK